MNVEQQIKEKKLEYMISNITINNYKDRLPKLYISDVPPEKELTESSIWFIPDEAGITYCM